MISGTFILGMLVLGGAVGIVSGALGLGGGLFMVPAFLEFVEGMDTRTAKGTSLFIIVFVAAVNVWRLNRGHKDWQWGLAGTLAVGSIVGAFGLGWATSLMPDRIVLWTFIVLLVGLGARTFFLVPPEVRPEDVRRRRVAAVCIGLATGAVSGATGIGGGAVLVPLALLAGLVANARVVALSNTVMVATCIAGSAAHFLAAQTVEAPWTYGQVNVALAPLVFLGAQVGSPVGKRLNEKLTLRWRRAIMGILLLIIAARLGYRALT